MQRTQRTALFANHWAKRGVDSLYNIWFGRSPRVEHSHPTATKKTPRAQGNTQWYYLNTIHTRTHHISHARGLISLRELLTPASSKVNSACCTRDSGVQLTINHGPMCWLWCKCRVRRAQLTPSDWERHGGICWAFLKGIAGSFFVIGYSIVICYDHLWINNRYLIKHLISREMITFKMN